MSEPPTPAALPPGDGPARAAGGARGASGRKRSWLDRLVPLAALLVTAVLRLLRATTRPWTRGEAAVRARWQRREPAIFAFWHEALALMPILYEGPGACIMVSRHRDGELIARAVRPLGIDTVRGSSTRGWMGAMRGLLAAHRRGDDLGIAVDGPRGPRHVVKSGVLQLARATGAPVVPIGAAARWRLRLGSWDRLQIPLPGSKVAFVAGPALTIAPSTRAEDLERDRRALEAALRRATAEAEHALGGDTPA